MSSSKNKGRNCDHKGAKHGTGGHRGGSGCGYCGRCSKCNKKK